MTNILKQLDISNFLTVTGDQVVHGTKTFRNELTGPNGTYLPQIGPLLEVQQTESTTILSPGNSSNNILFQGTCVDANYLTTARTINGVAFDGTQNITVPATDSTKIPYTGGPLLEVTESNGNTVIEHGTTTGNILLQGTAADATKLTAPVQINGVNFDGSSNITITATQNPIVTHLKQTGVQNFSNASTTVVTWPTAVLNPDGIWDAGAPTRLTAKRTCVWVVLFNYAITAAASGFREFMIYKNSDTLPNWQADMFFDNNGGTYPVVNQVSAIVPMVAGDYIECAVYLTGGPLDNDTSRAMFVKVLEFSQ